MITTTQDFDDFKTKSTGMIDWIQIIGGIPATGRSIVASVWGQTSISGLGFILEMPQLCPVVIQAPFGVGNWQGSFFTPTPTNTPNIGLLNSSSGSPIKLTFSRPIKGIGAQYILSNSTAAFRATIKCFKKGESKITAQDSWPNGGTSALFFGAYDNTNWIDSIEFHTHPINNPPDNGDFAIGTIYLIG